MEAILSQWRWFWRIDWDLIDLERTDERQMFPSMWSPYFVETWKCRRTGKLRTLDVF